MVQINNVIDMHVHVGLRGDKYPFWGKFSESQMKQFPFLVFCFFQQISPAEITDEILIKRTLDTIKKSKLGKVVCLALDHVFTKSGDKDLSSTNMFVANEFIIYLRDHYDTGNKVLFGASVHPFDPHFEERIKGCVEAGAVLIKWLPSAQDIDLTDERVSEALKILATARKGKPLPLLLHTGPEYAILPAYNQHKIYDFISWSPFDNIIYPGIDESTVERVNNTLRSGLDSGAVIIFAHCGLPYFSPAFISGAFGTSLEHSDLNKISEYIHKYREQCFADVSAFVTPVRKSYFNKVKKLPAGSLVYGSDFPTPVFELSASIKEVAEDFNAVLKGDYKRIVVPEDNHLDVHFNEIYKVFGEHQMFSNFERFLEHELVK